MIRQLHWTENDYLDYLNLLNQLSDVGNVTFEQYQDFVISQNAYHTTFVYETDKKLVGCITVLIEKKLLHGGKNVLHIEDVISDIKYRGQGISTILINHVIEYAKQLNCYKIILDCAEHNIDFYTKRGFELSGNQMRIKIK
jgi:glucosamine-phosphate N-acetyltransferase